MLVVVGGGLSPSKARRPRCGKFPPLGSKKKEALRNKEPGEEEEEEEELRGVRKTEPCDT